MMKTSLGAMIDFMIGLTAEYYFLFLVLISPSIEVFHTKIEFPINRIRIVRNKKDKINNQKRKTKI